MRGKETEQNGNNFRTEREPVESGRHKEACGMGEYEQ